MSDYQPTQTGMQDGVTAQAPMDAPQYPGQQPNYYPGYPGGYPAPYPYMPGYGPQPTGTSGLSVAAMICGICGFIYGIPAILGIIFGLIGLSQTKRSGQRGRGMAIAGIVTGVLWLAFYALVIVLIVNSPTMRQAFDNGYNHGRGNG